jgi:membrane peptidoglycan carboxypeptidase
MKPRIVDEIKFPDGKIIKYRKEEVRRVIKKTTSEIVTDMLVDSAAN